jgi:CDP-4-dehydro-6-deoxyglucose reductase, E1
MEYKVPLVRDAFLNDAETRFQLADFILMQPRLSMGHECKKFEEEFSAWQGRRYSVLFNSGSSANLALIQALLNMRTLKKGDRVGVSALTWATNVMPLIQLGLKPVVMDTDPWLLGNRQHPIHCGLAVAFVTSPLGFALLPKDRDVPKTGDRILLLEDNCESLGTVTIGGKAGNHGLASTFSFFVGHHLSTIEGGMVCTDDAGLADALRMVRAHGWDRNVSEYVRKDLREAHGVSDFHAPYTFYVPGYNLRPTEITGFLGRTQLPLMDEAILKRQAIYERFAAAQSKELRKLDRRHMSVLSAFAFPVIAQTVEMREWYRARFRIAGVEVRPLIAGNIQRHPFWKAAGLPVYPTPGADFLHDCAFYCPIRPDLTETEMQIIEGCLA